MEYTVTATNEMDELLVIGSTGQILQLTRRKHPVKVVPTSEKTILERDYGFFAALSSEMDMGNADTREV